MKYKFLIICFLFYWNVNSQPSVIKGKSTNSGLSMEELVTACNAYQKMTETETYLLHEKKTRLFAEKTKKLLDNPPDRYWEKDIFMEWLKKNISQTQFTSINEAELFINDMALTSEKMAKENKSLYELMSRATPDQMKKIVQPFFNRVKSELGN